MKKFILGTAMALVMSTAAHAETVGVSMAKFDDNFLTVLRNGMTDYAKTLSGVTLQVEDAQNDVSKQQSQIQNFIASKVDAIIVNPVDTDATTAMSKLAADAGIPLVYVNRQPVNVDTLPEAGFRRLQRAGIRHAGNQGNLPHSRRQGQGRGDHGRALQPGCAHAHPGHS